MYQSISIKNFRGFKTLKVSEFKRINLIAGMNNSGKTSLLEALFIHAGKNNPELVIAINAFRGVDNIKISFDEWSEMPWESVFYNREADVSIELEGKWNSQMRKLTISTKFPERINTKENFNTGEKSKYFESTSTIASKVSETRALLLEENIGKKTKQYFLKLAPQGFLLSHPPSPDFPGYFIYSRKVQSVKEDAELLGKLDVAGELESILETLKIIEPRLKRLTTIYVNDTPLIHGDIGLNKLLPLSYMGEGISRLASFLLRISTAKNGVIFIDEIENGFHYSILENIWKSINEISKKNNVQIFATTHSYECVKSAYRAFSKEDDYNFSYYRLDRLEDEIVVNSYDRDTLSYAFKTDIEVR